MADDEDVEVPVAQEASPSEKAFGEAFRGLVRGALVAAKGGEGQKAILAIALAEWAMVARVLIGGGNVPIVEGLLKVLAYLDRYACVDCGVIHGMPETEGGPPVPHPVDPGAVLH